jgi:transcriptional regulator with XRE-family HTH domain
MSTVLSDSEVRANIAANLRRILDSRGLTQADLARLSGESEMNISRVIRGESTAGTGIMARIAEALDVSLDRLVFPPSAEISKKIPPVEQAGVDGSVTNLLGS